MSYAQTKTQNTRKAKSKTEQTVATESNPDINKHVSTKTLLSLTLDTQYYQLAYWYVPYFSPLFYMLLAERIKNKNTKGQLVQ